MRRLAARLALSFVFAFSPLALASDADLAQAEQLLGRGQPQAAYDLLAPQLEQRAGDPDYDFLLGQAALETGKNGEAAFAFERCLAVDPRNGPCRMLMARTHLAMGENTSARLELETVQASHPPSEVRALVSQYLGVAAAQEAGEKRRVNAYAQLGLGYDDNITGTTDDTQVALPLFGGLPFQLTGSSSKQEDGFAQAEVGASLVQALGPAWSLSGDASVSGRRYQDVEHFDAQIVNASIGLGWRQGANGVLVRLQAQDYRLDGDAFRSLYGALLQYQYAFSEAAAVSAYLQGSHLDHHLPATPDADRGTLGGGYSRVLKGRFAPVVYAGLYGGTETSEGPDFLSQDFSGLRLGGSLGLTARLRLTGGVSAEMRRFDGPHPLFLTEREDSASDISLGAIYHATRRFSLRPTYTYTRNSSNIVVNDYNRQVIALDLRYDL